VLKSPPIANLQTVTGKFEEKIGGYLKRSFFGFLLACKIAVTKLAEKRFSASRQFWV